MRAAAFTFIIQRALNSLFINKNMHHVFVHEKKLYTVHYAPGVTEVRDGDNPSSVLEFRRVMQNGEYIECGNTMTPVLLCTTMVEPELFNRKTDLQNYQVSTGRKEIKKNQKNVLYYSESII